MFSKFKCAVCESEYTSISPKLYEIYLNGERICKDCLVKEELKAIKEKLHKEIAEKGVSRADDIIEKVFSEVTNG